jgi:predicted membrane protein
MEKRLIFKGTALLLGLYLAQVVILTAYANLAQLNSSLFGINLLLSFGICVGAGFCVGRRVRSQAFLHGFNVGRAEWSLCAAFACHSSTAVRSQ